jgi:hypothetical protein
MDIQLTTAEIDRLRETLPDYEPAQKALATLKAEDGNIETSFEMLWREKNGTPPQMGNKSLWQVTIQELRKEICGEDGSFRTKIKEYSKNPGSAPLLTGLIVYLVGIAGLPLDPAIATVIVLYILKVGLNIFCEYTKSEP